LHPGWRVQSTGTYAVDKHNGPVNYVTPTGWHRGGRALDAGGSAEEVRPTTTRHLRVFRRRRNMEIMLIYGAAIASGRHEAVMEE